MGVEDRQHILNQALEVTSRDRNRDYDEPEKNFRRIAQLWSAYLEHPVTTHDVAVMSLLIKVARIIQSPGKDDHWIDIAGYAACGWDAYLAAQRTEASDER